MQASIQARIVNLYVRQTLRRKLPDIEPVALRALIERGSIMPKLKGGRLDKVDEHGVKGEWHHPAQPEPHTVIFYLHGGGYIFGSPRTHRALTIPLAQQSRISVFSLDYRLAPENPFPAALDDAVTAWRWLTETMNIAPSRIAVGGDSAGGGLALALMLALKRQRLTLPGSLFLYSPYADQTFSGASIKENAQTDHMFEPRVFDSVAAHYAADGLDNPLISPLFGDLAGLPPTLTFVSETEMLRDDGVRVHEAMTQAGTPSTLVRRGDLIHVWPLFNFFVPEAKTDLRHTSDFIRETLVHASPAA